MSRALRWQVIVPRLLLVVVLMLATQFALGRFAQWIAVRSLEAAVDSPVDVAHARVSLIDRQLVLGDLRIRTASEPSRTLLEADCCALDFATAPLLHKVAVVQHGTLAGVRFNVASAGSSQSGSKPSRAATSIRWTDAESTQAAQRWLGRLDQCFAEEFPNRFASLEQTEKLCGRWPEYATELQESVRELKQRAANLQQSVHEAQVNPLRHEEFLKTLPGAITTLRADFARAAADMDRLAGSLESNRRAIVLARRQDEALVRNELQLEPIDASSLSAYLLRDQIATPLDEVLSALRWVRQVLPARDLPHSRSVRGENVVFAGCRPSPSLLIRNLHLQGTARIGGQTVELRGLLTNLTSMPRLHATPIRLRLETEGSLPLKLQATIDRTGHAARDELLIECRGIVMPPQNLGQSEGFQLKLAPSVASLSISVLVEGEKLSGDIQLVERQVKITPVLAGQLSDVPMTAALGATLSELDALAMRISLGGTLSEPTCSLWSNLGPAVAEAMERALKRAGDEHAQALLARTQQQVDERLTKLERLVNTHQADLEAQLGDATGQLKKVAADHKPAPRLSRQQLGRRLPTGSLFR